MKKTSIAIAAFALVIASGCKNQSDTTTASAPGTTSSTAVSASQTSLSPEDLGELGAKIKKSPSDAQKLLSEKGLTVQSFEQQVRQVAQDPEASKRYAAAYKKAT
jgi:hypothetical protein